MTTRLQERIESSAAGQIALSLFIVVTLVAVVVTNLPESLLRRNLLRVADPYLRSTGLDQNWRIFAPNPRQTSLRLEARVRYDDGSVVVWQPPAGGDLVGVYRDYRWRKWLENVTVAPEREVLWRPAAMFAARQVGGPKHTPDSVTLVMSSQELRAPGAPGPDRGAWRDEAFYTLSLR